MLWTCNQRAALPDEQAEAAGGNRVSRVGGGPRLEVQPVLVRGGCEMLLQRESGRVHHVKVRLEQQSLMLVSASAILRICVAKFGEITPPRRKIPASAQTR